jgi:predicted nucleotidyltransferase
METTKNKLPNNIIEFFEKLSNYIEEPVLFFGSIQRGDYFPGKSDIDVDIFTENVDSTIAKMQHFLHVKKSKFKKVVWRLNHNNKIALGYKLNYANEDEKIFAEFSIYNVIYKEGVLTEHKLKFVIPFYITWLLIILKFFHYKFYLINQSWFSYFKKLLLTRGIGLPRDEFIAIPTK